MKTFTWSSWGAELFIFSWQAFHPHSLAVAIPRCQGRIEQTPVPWAFGERGKEISAVFLNEKKTLKLQRYLGKKLLKQWQGEIRESFWFSLSSEWCADIIYWNLGIFFWSFRAVASSCWQAVSLGTKQIFQIGNCSVAWRSFSTSKNDIPFPVIKTQLSSWAKRSCWIPCSSSHPWEDFAGF